MPSYKDVMESIERFGFPTVFLCYHAWIHYRCLQDILKNQIEMSKTIEHVALHILGKEHAHGDGHDNA